MTKAQKSSVSASSRAFKEAVLGEAFIILQSEDKYEEKALGAAALPVTYIHIHIYNIMIYSILYIKYVHCHSFSVGNRTKDI